METIRNLSSLRLEPVNGSAPSQYLLLHLSGSVSGWKNQLKKKKKSKKLMMEMTMGERILKKARKG